MTQTQSTCPLSIIVLAYNEEENVQAVVGELRTWLAVNAPGAEIVFIDDGSSDNTAAEAERALRGANATIVAHEVNRGMGGGLKSGVRAARGEWVTFMPADGQIAPESIGTLRALSGPDVDVVFSVYDGRDDGAYRTVLSWGVRALIRAVHGVSIESDGPYLFRRALFDPAQLTPDTFFINFEFPIRVASAQLRTKTATIECRPRRAGQSKTSGLKRIALVAKDLGDLRRRRIRSAAKRLVGRDDREA